MPSITFLPDGPSVTFNDGESIFDVGRRAGVRIPTSCVGKASCGLCRVKIISGEEHLTPLNSNERRHLGNVYFITKVRLACQTRVSGGDVTVEIP